MKQPEQQILDLIRLGPVSSNNIAQALDMKLGTIGARLRRLKAAGLVTHSMQNCYTLWFVKEHRAKATALIKSAIATKLAKTKAVEKERWRKKRELQVAAAAAREAEAFEKWLTPERRVVPATACQMPRNLGPCSVFELAKLEAA